MISDRIVDRLNEQVDRLSRKIEQSRTPVPGFIMGLSGTDSVLAFIIAYRAMAAHNKGHRVLGISYGAREKTAFAVEAFPWLAEQCPEAVLQTLIPLGGNYDQQRWADLHLRALNKVEDNKVTAWPDGENFWVVGTINASERMLGTYSVLADTASVQAIETIWKSDVMAMCEYLGAPQYIMDNARIPDCWCGRDELAAENIELIDDILRHRIDSRKHDPELLTRLTQYIAEKRALNDFKNRIPFVV